MAWIGPALAAGTIVVYDLTFLTTTGYRATVVGSVAAATILGWFAGRGPGPGRDVSVPMWGLLGLATPVTGGVIGVLYGILIGEQRRRQGAAVGRRGRHPGHHGRRLRPGGTAVVEWWLRARRGRTKATRPPWQMALLFLGGFTLMLGVLLDAVPSSC